MSLATSNKSTPGKVDVPWTARVYEGVVVPISTLPLGLTVRMDTPVELLIWKGFKVVVPWTSKETVEEEALTPTTVPSSKMVEVARAEADVHLAT